MNRPTDKMSCAFVAELMFGASRAGNVQGCCFARRAELHIGKSWEWMQLSCSTADNVLLSHAGMLHGGWHVRSEGKEGACHTGD